MRVGEEKKKQGSECITYSPIRQEESSTKKDNLGKWSPTSREVDLASLPGKHFLSLSVEVPYISQGVCASLGSWDSRTRLGRWTMNQAVHLDSSIDWKPHFSGPATSLSVAKFSSHHPLPAPAPAFELLKRNDSIRTIQAKELPPFLSLACSSLWPRITAYAGSFDPTERLGEGVLIRLRVSLSALLWNLTSNLGSWHSTLFEPYLESGFVCLWG